MKLSLYLNQHDEVLSQAEVIEHLEQKLAIAVDALKGAYISVSNDHETREILREGLIKLNELKEL